MMASITLPLTLTLTLILARTLTLVLTLTLTGGAGARVWGRSRARPPMAPAVPTCNRTLTLTPTLPLPLSRYWDKISTDAKDFVGKLLVVDPKKRMDCRAALKHRWLLSEQAAHLAAHSPPTSHPLLSCLPLATH